METTTMHRIYTCGPLLDEAAGRLEKELRGHLGYPSARVDAATGTVTVDSDDLARWRHRRDHERNTDDFHWLWYHAGIAQIEAESNAGIMPADVAAILGEDEDR